jgi:phenylalanyl-tRNA synthetase alpha chain
MQPQIEQLRREADEHIQSVANASQLEEFRVAYLARKGKIASLFEQLKTVPPDQRPALGKSLNELRAHVQHLHDSKASSFTSASASATLDLTQMGRRGHIGTKHPLMHCRRTGAGGRLS